MSKYRGDLTEYGQTNSLFGKNIEAYYRAPKKALDFKDEVDDYLSMSAESLIALIPSNWHDESGDYYEGELQWFEGKDGQTNAYVKQGLDNEQIEFLDRQQTNQITWQFATDDNHIKFLSGGKIITRNKEWFILKVISQDSTSSTTNKYEAMDTSPNNDTLEQFGFKTLVLIGA